jgi:hypothetical protein
MEKLVTLNRTTIQREAGLATRPTGKLTYG